MPNFENLNLDDVVTPINMSLYRDLLIHTGYNSAETAYLVAGFQDGFDLKYMGPKNRQDLSHNIPLMVGDRHDMWAKIMKEVKCGRYAGPYDEIPYGYYVQSPIGLVPKAGNKTHLIFHLSYDFKSSGQKSINFWTPERYCTVCYNDLDVAVLYSLNILKQQPVGKRGSIYDGKTDLVSAFCLAPVLPLIRYLFVMKAYHPLTGKCAFFIDKNLAFGHSMSCAIFQRFSNSLKHMIEVTTSTKWSTVNYLDDYLFIQATEEKCNEMVSSFLELCHVINCPVSLEKTFWASTCVEFLGMLLDGTRQVIAIPIEKKDKAEKMLLFFIDKRKATVKELQRLAGFLNFLTKVIMPGRGFI